MRVRLFQSIFALTTLTVASTASAHFELDAPVSSSADKTSGGKGGYPCGPDDTAGTVTSVMGGSMLEIKIRETTYHPGHYRVAIAVNSRDELDPTKGGLLEPVVKNAGGMVLENKAGSADSDNAAIQNPPVFPVIADGLYAHTANMSPFAGAMVTIPNMNCEKCTLQVIEFMAKHGPDYFYRHCADIKITADPNKPIMGGGGSGGSGGGGGGAGGASGGMAGAGGAAMGGTPGTSGSGGVPPGMAGTGTAGTGTAGTGTAGTGSLGGGNAADEGSCSVAGVGMSQSGVAWSLASGLLLGLGWFARRRNRAA